jgi:hypothetical protein
LILPLSNKHMHVKSYILLFALLAVSLWGRAQKNVLFVGSSSALTIKSGTTFSADSLVLTPGADLTLASNTIQVSPVALNLSGGPTIKRVYTLSSPIVFTGTLQLWYQPTELNGLSESSLNYADSMAGVAWLSQGTSTVNTSLHYVQFAVVSHSFSGSTASGPNLDLPLSLLSFGGSWVNVVPLLNWTVAQDGGMLRFEIESAADGTNWQKTGDVDGDQATGVYTYGFSDNKASPPLMYYRLKLIEGTGNVTYSRVLTLQKGDGDDGIRLLTRSNGAVIRFSGNLPDAIRLVNVLGMVLRSERSSQAEYELTGLIPGAYFFQYEIKGRWQVREFVVQ